MTTLANGLVAWWDFDENHDAVSGYASHDGNNILAQPTKPPTVEHGPLGNHIVFDGGAGGGTTNPLFIAGASATDFELTSAMTHLCWFTLDKTTSAADFDTLGGKYDIANNRGWLLFLNSYHSGGDDQKILAKWGNGTSGQFTTSPASVVAGLRCFVCYRVNGVVGSLDFYSDTQLLSSNTTSGSGSMNATSTAEDFVIGGQIQNSVTQEWKGTMDSVGIYNRALTDAEVLEAWNSGAGVTYSGYIGPMSRIALRSDPGSLHARILQKQLK